MNEKTAIRVKNLTKVYKLYNKPTDRMKEALHPLRKQYHNEFYALKDVSFDIPKGETIGIIGKNGAGKSTLLKILTGVLTKTSGDLQVNGRVAALLELGAGFNPELNGIDNIYLNGTIMGISKDEMTAKLQEIIDFADIGDFIYQPVKMYSSGMFARLAFAVSINVDPDILIVDEALSVGDAMFQLKCFKKFNEFREAGKTILFVTHGMDTVIRYCTSAILIQNGQKIAQGPSKEIVDLYKKAEVNLLEEPTVEKNKITNTKEMKSYFAENKDALEYGNGVATIMDYATLDLDGNPTSEFDSIEKIKIMMKVKFHQTIENPIFAFAIKDIKGTELCGTNTMVEHIETGKFQTGDEAVVYFTQALLLNPGDYALSLGCTGFKADNFEVYHRLYDVLLFSTYTLKPTPGLFSIDSKIEITK